MRLATITLPGRGETDRLLAALAARLQGQGVALAGAVQFNVECGEDCEMEVQVLPDGPVIGISQSLGPGSQGCRLDAGALEAAVAEVAARMAGARLLIVNKFGKHEAEGRGFRTLIAEALASGMPVLLGVNAMNMQSFQVFAEGLAEPVLPDTLDAWLAEVLA
ncbi:MAG: DUF2478 domain-containing protein [Gemmobacter sp.]|uniref:DUF2478 domain-containing protein n=1 Tax=Gemmobacter sp. TaxID=1898957 RepID=UPI001A5A461F|nr:DUF2478 domain-containing protein [Gemmobacter sp.]MBL8564061.1 DUF2478 domain-containing protein [Gemmobacter sp.]